jgi:glycosyltransferase involved in cell wall biosynthesis
VAFDHRIFVHQKHGGISRYFARLAEHLPKFSIEPKIISPLYQTEYLEYLPKQMIWGRRFTASPKVLRSAVVIGEALHRPLASLFGADVVHESYHHFRRVAPSRAKIVTTVYDLIWERSPVLERDQYAIPFARRNLRDQVHRADKIICISESTRRDLIDFHPEVADKTEVILFGFDPMPPAESAPPPHPKPYLLYVGMRWRGYKNFLGLVSAYAASERLRAEFDLVCVGGGPLNPEELSLIKSAGVEGKVFQRNADDQALQNYYRHAHLFVYPSLYEGFGMPLLEAMAANCPVVCMKISSMPEVCADAAEYAFPDQPESLQAAIERVAFSSDRAEALRAAGTERLKLFSWTECARQTSEIYKSLLK